MDTLPPIHLSSLVRITAAVSLRDEPMLTRELKAALDLQISIPILREALLQTYLFAGYAAAINAFIVLNSLLAPDASSENWFLQENDSSLELWRNRGTDLCRRIYGNQFDKLLDNMKQLHPDLADWMIWEGYGKVLCRPFLSPRIRELLIVGMTAVLGVERQFHSHVRGALHVGSTQSELKDVFHDVRPFLNEQNASSLEETLNELLSSK